MHRALQLALATTTILVIASASLARDKDDTAGQAQKEGLYAEEYASPSARYPQAARPAPRPSSPTLPITPAEKGSQGYPSSPDSW